MATREKLREWIEDKVQDDSFTATYIDDLINEAIEDVFGEVLLPACEASSAVTTVTSGPAVALPSDFGRELYGASIADQDPPQVLATVESLQRRYPNFETDQREGDVEFVCVRAGELIYYPVPSTAVDIHLNYYRVSPPLTSDRSEPTDIPSRFQRKMIVNYVLKEIFEDIEDGDEGQKVNTLRYEGNYLAALEEFTQATKTQQSRLNPPRDRKEWI